MKCEFCYLEHKGKYGSGRFCSEKCARTFSGAEKRKESSLKVSKTLKGRPSNIKGHKLGPRSKEVKSKISKTHYINYINKINSLEWENLSPQAKKTKVLYEQNYKCYICNNNIWLNAYLTLQLHHIDGDKQNNNRDNLQCLCPNCHSLTPTFGYKNVKPENRLGKFGFVKRKLAQRQSGSFT